MNPAQHNTIRRYCSYQPRQATTGNEINDKDKQKRERNAKIGTFYLHADFTWAKKFCVWLCWRGWQPPATHQRGPTTDSHGDSWLLGFPPGPVRPSLDNLTPPSSPGGSMLMQALVRTPDQHEPVTTRSPLLKPSSRTCLLVAGLQEPATTPGDESPVQYQDSWPGTHERTGLYFFDANSKIISS